MLEPFHPATTRDIQIALLFRQADVIVRGAYRIIERLLTPALLTYAQARRAVSDRYQPVMYAIPVHLSYLIAPRIVIGRHHVGIVIGFPVHFHCFIAL